MWDLLLGLVVISAPLVIFILASWSRPKKRSNAEDDPIPGSNVRADLHDHNTGSHP